MILHALKSDVLVDCLLGELPRSVWAKQEKTNHILNLRRNLEDLLKQLNVFPVK